MPTTTRPKTRGEISRELSTVSIRRDIQRLDGRVVSHFACASRRIDSRRFNSVSPAPRAELIRQFILSPARRDREYRRAARVLGQASFVQLWIGGMIRPLGDDPDAEAELHEPADGGHRVYGNRLRTFDAMRFASTDRIRSP